MAAYPSREESPHRRAFLRSLTPAMDSGTNSLTNRRTAQEYLRAHIAAARDHATSPRARAHLGAALAALDELPLTPLVECPVCGKLGLPERIYGHACPTHTQLDPPCE